MPNWSLEGPQSQVHPRMYNYVLPSNTLYVQQYNIKSYSLLMMFFLSWNEKSKSGQKKKCPWHLMCNFRQVIPTSSLRSVFVSKDLGWGQEVADYRSMYKSGQLLALCDLEHDFYIFRSLIKDWKKKNMLWDVKMITSNFSSTDKVSSEHTHTQVLSVAAFALNWQSGVIITEIQGPKARSICHLALCRKSVLTTRVVANVNHL